jgi:hypothetical protein
VIPPFDDSTGGLPPGDHTATLTEIGKRLGFTPRRRWLIKGLRQAVKAFWAAGIKDGYWVEPDPGVYDRLDPYWIDFELVLVPHLRKWKWRMWADHGVEFFVRPAMDAAPNMGFPEFFRQDRDGRPRGIIRIVREKR